MTPSQLASSAPILLLILYGVAQRIAVAIPLVGDQAKDTVAPSGTAGLWLGDERAAGGWPEEAGLMQTLPHEQVLDVDPRTLAVALLETLSKPVQEIGSEKSEADRAVLEALKKQQDNRMASPSDMASAEGQQVQGKSGEVTGKQGLEQPIETQLRNMVQEPGIEEQLEKEMGEKEEEKEYREQEEAMRDLQTILAKLQRHSIEPLGQEDVALERQARGYFPNIDLGLQDNEILPPLKGYKLYNQQLARAGKKLNRKTPPPYNQMNFMRDFEEEEENGDEEFLTREEEEARARAEQEEVRRQEAEAQRARAEEERLADIASDRVLQYMVKKQAAGYASQRRKTALATNAVEDKRSEEEDEDDDIDPQTIDKLIEISSKLHLPADDVVDIISDVEEKKKRKDAPQTVPRYRPLVAPPAPAFRYATAARPLPFSSYTKWVRGKGRAWKQDLWSKPQKQFLAYPSYPFYQKPYRAYYPVYFSLPKPKPHYYAKSVLSLDELLGNSMHRDFDIPKRRYRPWGQPRPRKRPAQPQGPFIPNYILPHPRTYSSPPIAKARSTPRLRSSLYYPGHSTPVAQDDRYYDLTGQQQDSDEELENFIEKIYLKRRLF